MTTLSLADAVALVRKNLDELDPNGSNMYTDENGSSYDYGDNASLNLIVRRNLPEAINAVHLAAPVALLEGKPFADSDLDSVDVSSDGILSFTLKESTDFLRLVAFRASDSAIVVTDVLAEASPEGRKQLNPYIRGRADRPRLVILQGRHTGPSFKYYTLDFNDAGFASLVSDPSSAIAQLAFVQELFHTAWTETPNPLFPISRRLRQNMIDCLTAKVMEAYGDQRTQSFLNKANSFPNI